MTGGHHIEVVEGVEPADDRNTFIGASEVACLFDQHQFLTRGEKFAAVCEDKQPTAPTAAMRAGHLAERIIFDLLADGAVKELAGVEWEHLSPRGVRWLDREHGLAAMPDGVGKVSGDETVLVDAKFTSSPVNLSPDYGRLYWWWQLQGQMACCPFPVGRGAVVMLGGDLQLRHWWIERDEPAINAIRFKAREFWREVAAGRCENLGRLPKFYEMRPDIVRVEGGEGEMLDDLCDYYAVALNAEKRSVLDRREQRDALLHALGARGEWHTRRHKIKVGGAVGRTPTIRITEWA